MQEVKLMPWKKLDKLFTISARDLVAGRLDSEGEKEHRILKDEWLKRQAESIE